MSNHAEICPVCKGAGKYKDYSNGSYGTSVIYMECVCHGCKGKGWITVNDNIEEE